MVSCALYTEKSDQVERCFDHARGAAAFPRSGAAAVHAGADVAAAHPLAALQRPGFLCVFVTLFADLDAVGHLEAALLHLLFHQRGVLQPGSQRQFDAHRSPLRCGCAFFACQHESALATVIGIGADGRALIVLALRLADADLALEQLDAGAVQVALRQQVDELARPDGLDDQLVGGGPAGLAGQLDLDVRRAVAGDVLGVDVEHALRLVFVVSAGRPLPERLPTPRPGVGRGLELPQADVVALRRPGLRTLAHRFLGRAEAGPPEDRVELAFVVETADPTDAEARERPRVQRGEFARERHLLALQDDRDGARWLGQRARRLERRAVIGVFPRQREDFLVALAAKLLERGRAPAALELPFEVGQRRRQLRIELEAQRDGLGAVLRLFPGDLGAGELVGVARKW